MAAARWSNVLEFCDWMSQRAGGQIEWSGRALASVIAPPDEHWDEVFIVRYPDVEAFIGMIMAPDYQAQTIHRTAALADSRLILTVPPAAKP